MKKLSALLIAFCLIAALICSCSSGPKSDGATDSSGSGGHYDEIGSDPPKQDGAKDPSSPEQKLIKKYRITLESTEYDKTRSEISALVEAYGG